MSGARGKSWIKLLPITCWIPKVVNEYNKDFVNHKKKMIISCRTFPEKEWYFLSGIISR